MFKKLTALVLVMGMVLSLFAGCQQGVPGSDGTLETIVTPLGVHVDINSEFTPNGFYVLLTEEAAKNIDAYVLSDFSEVKGKELIKKADNLLWITLEKPSKENVFEGMKLMLKRSDVLGVEPNFIAELA